MLEPYFVKPAPVARIRAHPACAEPNRWSGHWLHG